MEIIEPHAGQGKSAASWPAIIAGAFVAASVSLVLLALGAGLGFAAIAPAIAPWQGHAVSAKTFAITTAIWFIVMQWLSAGVGGYITGRLRTRWIGTHPHEVFFRDTAHGLVTWSVATVVVSAVIAMPLFSALGGEGHALAYAASGAARSGTARGEVMAASAAVNSAASAYDVDKLFREAAAGGPGLSDPRGEAGRIVANAWATGGIPDADRSYLAEQVAARTGVSPAVAQKRVDDFVASTVDAISTAKTDAAAAAKAAAQASIYTALAMLVGAFIASVSAALGGRLRDEHL
jgi:hypothetical protein